MASKASMIVRYLGHLKKTPKSAIICPFIGSAMVTNYFVGNSNEFSNKEYDADEEPAGKLFVAFLGYWTVSFGLSACAILSKNRITPAVSMFAGAATGALVADYPQMRIYANIVKFLLNPEEVENSKFKHFVK